MKSGIACKILDVLRMCPSLDSKPFTDTSRLSGSTAKTHVPRMYYKNFDDNITAKFGVILKGWPLKDFQNPSVIKSKAELQVLKNSLDSGATYFKKLTPSELTEWEEARFQSRLEETTEHETPDIPTNIPGPEDLEPPTITMPTANPSLSDPDPDPPSDLSVTAASGSKRPSPDDGQGPAKKRTNDRFVNLGVTAIDGTAVIVHKKPRKPRSDKGKKRSARSRSN